MKLVGSAFFSLIPMASLSFFFLSLLCVMYYWYGVRLHLVWLKLFFIHCGVICVLLDNDMVSNSMRTSVM